MWKMDKAATEKKIEMVLRISGTKLRTKSSKFKQKSRAKKRTLPEVSKLPQTFCLRN